MAPELEKPRVTEIQVRMNCNGCVQKIKKALHGIDGIYDVYIDFPQQKLTVVGWADPEKILKAVKKTRKTATICSHKEAENATPEENPPPTESPAADPEPAPPAEPPKEPPPPQPSGNQPKEEASPPPAAAGYPTPAPAQPPSPAKLKEVEEIRVVHHHPHHLGYGNQWNLHMVRHGFRPHETPYHVATHSYNTHGPSPSVLEYEYHRPPPPTYARFSRADQYVDEYQYQHGREGEGGDGNQITSIFSDENPNACRIV